MVFHTNLLTSGNLAILPYDVEEQAREMFDRLVKHTAEREVITESLKSENQMEWFVRMNNIRSRATKAINANLIYT